MSRKIIRTTQQRIVTDRAAPVETIQEREVVRAVRGRDGLLEYQSSTTVPELYQPNLPAVASRDEVAVLGSRVRALENETQSRSVIQHDLDYRVTHLEEANRGWGAAYAVERATWWTLWYILMLVLGSALVIFITLILLSLIRTS